MSRVQSFFTSFNFDQHGYTHGVEESQTVEETTWCDCVIDSCEIYGYTDGVYVNGVDSSVKLIDCVIHSNKSSGILASEGSTVDIFGLKSDVKHNGRSGIRCQDQSTVNIHLPKVHRTAHDNGGENYDKTSDSTINIDV